MTHHFSTSTLLSLGIWISATLVGVEAPAAEQSANDALRAMATAAGTAVEPRVSATTGLATFAATKPGEPIPTGVSSQATAGIRARAFLNRYGAAFGITDTNELALRRQPAVDEIGMEHVRFLQTHKAIPVTGGELTVHLSGDAVVAVNARTLGDFAGVSLSPVVTPAESTTVARRVLASERNVSDALLSEPRLELFNRGLLEGRRTPTRLAWFIEATALDLRQYLWIDAETNAVLLQFSQLAHARDREVYNAASGPALPGALARSETDGPTGNVDVDTAFEHAGDTWDYFWITHGRDSFDDAGATLVSSVDYCPAGGPCPYPNAFWNGSQMVYGDGYPAADDVAAHEITHAVIEHTADFFYYMQSGALSESYADAFGEAVDLINGSGNDDTAMRWLLGEDRPCGDSTPGACASRSMMDPNLFGDPASMNDWRFTCEDPGDDGGGLHSNSGVPNHAFALLVDGGTFNNVTTSGIGLAKAEKIYYRALAYYLLSASNFVDHSDAIRQSCTDLIGTDGIIANDCLAVGQVIEAVELDQPWPCEQMSPTADVLCPAVQVTSTLFSDDLESGTSNWSTSTSVGSNVWGLGHDFATSSNSHLRGDLLPQCDPDAFDFFTDSSIELASGITIPPTGAYLQFAHAFGFENYSEFDPHEYYDGGVLEYSVDGGAGWYDLGHLIAAGADYGGTIDPDFGNPLGGRSGFVGDSWGYTSTQVDLLPLGGYTVRLRFRIGTDDTTDFCDYGWFVDDVRIFECHAACLAMPVSGCLECTPALSLLSGGAIEGVETWVGCDSISAGQNFGIGGSGLATLIAPLVKFVDGFFVDAGGQLTVRTR
jgi:Zn-dependent metalloprotease